MSRHPDMRHERKLWKAGIESVAGVDEAGVGPMAGPVVAAAVIFAPEIFIKGVHDSKQLLPEQREELYPVDSRACARSRRRHRRGRRDRSAQHLPRRRDGVRARAWRRSRRRRSTCWSTAGATPVSRFRRRAIVGGDRKSFCIAAASIVAKVMRDRIMLDYDARFPDYGFASHKGYCTADHFAALERLGPSPIHRRSFAPVIAGACNCKFRACSRRALGRAAIRVHVIYRPVRRWLMIGSGASTSQSDGDK